MSNEPKCEQCGTTKSTGPWIWSVPHWFCSHECKRTFYDKYFDVVQDDHIITLNHQQCPKCNKQMEYLYRKRIFICYSCTTKRLQDGEILE